MTKAKATTTAKAPAKAATTAKATNAPDKEPVQKKDVEAAPKVEEPEKTTDPKKAGNDPAPGADGGNDKGADTAAGMSQADYDDAFKAGYSQGFTDALEGSEGGSIPTPTEYGDITEDAGGTSSQERLAIIALAIRTPENYRKGGIASIVEQVSAFLDSLPPGDRYPALVLAREISDKHPQHIASGRYELEVRAGLDALNGVQEDHSHRREEYDPAEAARRLETQAMPEDVIVDEEEEGLDAEADPRAARDPNSSASAADRLRSAL